MKLVTDKRKHNKNLTGYTEVVQRHTIKVRIGVTAGNPPFKRVLDVLDWFPKVLSQLAGTRPSLFSHRDVGEGCVVVVVVTVNLRNRLAVEYMRTEFVDLQAPWACRGLTHSNPLFPRIEQRILCTQDLLHCRSTLLPIPFVGSIRA